MENRRIAKTLEKRLLAFVLALTIILANVGADMNTVFAATSSESITFSMSGSQLVAAIEEAIAEGNEVTAEDLDFTNGKIAEFEKLFDGREGKVYEAYPDPEGGSRDAELRVFVRLPEDADDMYMVIGDEEVIFLYINNGEDTISCTTEITRMDGGVEKVKKTKRVTVKSYEAVYGDEGANIITKPAEETTAPEEPQDPETGETASPTESPFEPTVPSEEGTAAAPDETEEATAAPEDSRTEAETEALEKSEPMASIVRHIAPVVAENESGNTADAPSDPSEAPETEENPDGTTEDTVKETTTAADDETAVPDTDEDAEAPAESGPSPVDNSDGASEAPSESAHMPETATASDAKAENSVPKTGASNLVGIGYCSTAKAYTTTLNQLKALEDFDGYEVSYTFYPEYSGRIVEGMRGVEEGEALTFGVKNQTGYTVDSVTANGETLVPDSITDNRDGSQTINYSVPGIYEEQEIEVYMSETEAHPEFNQVLEMEDGTVITLYAQEGVLPAGVEAEASVADGIEETVIERVERESGDEITAVSAVAYDINLMLNGHKLDNSWSSSGYVEVTFSGDKIEKMQEGADGIEVFALDNSAANLTADELKLEKVMENDITVQSENEISFKAKHFTIYTPVAYQSKAAEPRWYSGTFKPTIEHAEVAYLFYHNEVGNDPFTEVIDGKSITIEQFFNQNNKGHMLFFVRPEKGYLLTGVGASGNGDMYSLDLENYGNINRYPGIASITERAKAEGYVACFGFSRALNSLNQNNFTATLEVNGVKPGLKVEAVSSKTENVLPGDMLNFTVTITPKTEVNGKTLTVEGVSVESLITNGQSVDYNEITENSDGTYTTTVAYKVSEEDCEKGGIILNVNADVDYSYYLSLKDSNHISSNVITKATVIDSASVASSIAEQKSVQYKLTYENAPSGSYPERVKQTPVDSHKYYQNEKVSVDSTLKDGEVIRDENNGGFWIFDGWYLDGNKVTAAAVDMTEAGLEFAGVWSFKSNLAVNVKYVEYIADDTDYSNAAGLAEQEQLTGAYLDTYSPEVKQIEHYVFEKVIDNNNPKTFHEGMTTIYVAYSRKIEITITAASSRFTYDGKAHSSQKVTVTAGELRTGDRLAAKATGSITNVVDNAAGNNQIEADYKIMNDTTDVTEKYDITPEDGTLEIIPKKALITVISASKDFGKDDPKFTGTVEGLIAEDDLGTVEYNREAADKDKENAGDDISLTAYYTPNPNYAVTIIPAKLKILAPGANEVMVTGREVTYDGTPYGLTDAHAAREDSTLLYSTDNVTFTETAPVFTNAGVYVVYVKAINPYYPETGVAEGKVIIRRRDVTFTAGSARKVYDGTPLTDDHAEISSGSIADGQTWSVNVSGSQRLVGTSKNIASSAVIKAGDDVVTVNYNTNYIAGDLTVTSSGGSSGGSGGNGSSGNTSLSGAPNETANITPQDVPLAQLPETLMASAMVNDGEIPKAALPKTGQSYVKATFIMMISGILLVLTTMSGKRKEKNMS